MDRKYISRSEPAGVHPRIRAWDSWRSEPGFTGIEVAIRQERDGLVLPPARLCVTFMHGESVGRYDEVDWDIELDAWLITAARAKGASVSSEKTRFSLWLRVELKGAIRRYGDGYFNWVLVELTRRDFVAHPDVAAVLPAIHLGGTVSPESRRACEEAIETALSRVGTAIASMHGDTDVSADILGGALAIYLDERFSITTRSLLGFR